MIHPVRVEDPGPDDLTIEELLFDFRYSKDLKPQFDGLTMRELMEEWTPELVYLKPNESLSIDLELSGAGIMCRDVMGASSVGFMRSDDAGPAYSPIDVRVTEMGFEVEALKFEAFEFEIPFGSFLFPKVHYFAPGMFTLKVTNDTEVRRTLWVLQYPPFDSFEPQAVQFHPFLSARRLLSNATFLTLFRGQMPPEGEGLKVNDLCYLFTDLEDSTAMYDRVGDATAYNLVRLHFEVLNELWPVIPEP